MWKLLCLSIKNSITLMWQVVNVEEKALKNGIELELIKERQKKRNGILLSQIIKRRP